MQSGPAESKEETEGRTRPWERFAHEDPEVVRLFMAPLWESVNFDKLSCADTPTMATLHE